MELKLIDYDWVATNSEKSSQYDGVSLWRLPLRHLVKHILGLYALYAKYHLRVHEKSEIFNYLV